MNQGIRLAIAFTMALAGFLVFALPSDATVITHTGQTDPATEGWNDVIQGGTGTWVGGNDPGPPSRDYVEIQTLGSGANTMGWQASRIGASPNADVDTIMTNPEGWYLKAVLRVPTPQGIEQNAPSLRVADNLGDDSCDKYPTGWPNGPFNPGGWGDYWSMHFLDTGDPQTSGAYIQPLGELLAMEQIWAGDITTWHSYEMVMTPGATLAEDKVDYKVDGAVVATKLRSEIYNNRYWGNFLPEGYGNVGWGRPGTTPDLDVVAQFSFVEFGTVPEPGTTALLAMAGVCLLALFHGRRGK